VILRKDANSSLDALFKSQFTRLFNVSFSIWLCRRSSPQRRPDYRALVLVLSMTATGILSGCGSNLSGKAGAISVTDPSGTVSGQLTSLAVGAKANVVMTPVNDTLNVGVDWSVLCSGSPITGNTTNGACGTISPAHTIAGAIAVYTAPTNIPIDNTVTISAALTSNPSARSSSTLTIGSPSVSISGITQVTSLYVGGTAQFSVALAYDTTSAGAKWTVICGSSDCGSFSKATTTNGQITTYTAPSTVPTGSTVTITATSIADTSKSVSTTVTILPVYPITVSISPTVFQIGQGTAETANLIATVSNDSTNAGVDWSVSCGSASACGRFASSWTASGAVVTYIAPQSIPSGNTVTITATAKATKSNAQPATATATATIISASTITVSVSSSPSTVTVNETAALTAIVSKDTTNAGVAWSVSCGSAGACGSITNAGGSNGTYTATYTAPVSVPSGGLVSVIATPLATSLQGDPGMATLTISAVKPTIAITQAPSSMTVNGTAKVNAAVSNDSSASGVKWSISCSSAISKAGGCGYLQSYQTASGVATTYTAPPFVPTGSTVTINATSVANSSASVSSVVKIAASTTLAINFVPSTPTQVEAGSTVNVNAAVSNDTTNAGVDWSVCSSGCGYFTITPEIPAIAATTKTSYVAPVPAVTATSVQAWPNGLTISYTAPSIVPTGGAVVLSAAAHVNSAQTTAAAVLITSENSGPALHGVVQAGTLPVIGAKVALYAAGASGYGSASTAIYGSGQNAYATTDSSGNFTLPSGYQCPSSTSQMYLLSIGGQAGSNAVNENLVMMTLLGPCGALNSSSVTVNEVTTVASAWSVAAFAANPLTTGKTSYLYIGSSSSNTTGLANAFAAFTNLVNSTTGQSLFVTPAGNAVVPFAAINTLADILNACAVTGGGTSGDNSVCGNLFLYANPYNNVSTTLEYSGIPYDTLQAAIEVAQNPFFDCGNNCEATGYAGSAIRGADMYAMASSASPFQPILSSTPNDFSLSLNYTSGGGLTAASGVNYIALDGSGDLWISNSATNKVTEWNNQGAAMTSGYTTGTLAAPGPIAIDPSGNAWICGQNGLTELNFVGQEQSGSPFGGGGLTSSGCLNMVIDGSGNIWATNSASATKFDQYGNAVSPATGYTLAISPTNSNTATVQKPLAIDNAGNVWVGVSGVPQNSSSLYLAELSNSSGEPNDLGSTSTYFAYVADSDQTQTQIVADKSGNIWTPSTTVVGGGYLHKTPPFGGTGTVDMTQTPVDCSGGSSGYCSLAYPRGIAIDGAGVIWIGNAGMTISSGMIIQPNLTEYNPSLSSVYNPGFVSSSLSNQPQSVAVDISGNVWVLLDNNTITEYIGIATPAVTPLSLAVKKQKLGVKP
jgi:hypothetical protein